MHIEDLMFQVITIQGHPEWASELLEFIVNVPLSIGIWFLLIRFVKAVWNY